MTPRQEILLVEDNPYDIELITECFKKWDLDGQLMVARDGEEALDYFYKRGKFQRRTGPNPSLLILDLRLPKVNGIEVLHIIKNDDQLKNIPVVVVTAYPEVKDLLEIENLSIDCIEKPVEYFEFQNALKKLVLEKLQVPRESSRQIKVA